MQNVFHKDLQSSVIDKESYSKTLYIRINNDVRIKELERQGWVVIKQDESSDLILYGLPKPVEDEHKDNGTGKYKGKYNVSKK